MEVRRWVGGSRCMGFVGAGPENFWEKFSEKFWKIFLARKNFRDFFRKSSGNFFEIFSNIQ